MNHNFGSINIVQLQNTELCTTSRGIYSLRNVPDNYVVPIVNAEELWICQNFLMYSTQCIRDDVLQNCRMLIKHLILTIIYYYWWVKIQVQAMDIHTSNAKIEVLDTGPLVVLGHRSKIGSGKANFCFNRRLISWWELELAMPMPMSHARGVWGHAPSPTPLPRKILKFNSSKMAF